MMAVRGFTLVLYVHAQLAPNDTATMMPPTTNTGPPVGGLPAGVTTPVSNILYRYQVPIRTWLTVSVAT